MALYFQGQTIPKLTPEQLAQLERQEQARIAAGEPSWLEKLAAQAGKGFDLIKVEAKS